MAGEVKLTVEQCQARIAELRKPENGGFEKNKAEIEKLNQMITDAITGKAEQNGGKVVESSTVDISTEMGATFSAKQKTADQAIIDQTKQNSGKSVGKKKANENIKDEYGYRDENGKLLSKEEAKAKLKELDKERKAKEKALKQAEKDWKKAMKSGDDAKADELEAKYDKLAEEYQEFKTKYDKDVAALRVNAEQKGAVRGIRKAADHNVKNYENVQDVADKKSFRSKAEEEKYLKDHPDEKGKTIHLADDEFRALKQLQKYGAKQIAKAEATGDPKKIKDAHQRYDHYADMIDEDGNINTKAVQNVLVEYTGGDQNLNLDEKELLTKKLNVGNSKFVKQGDVKDLYDKFGFGTESALKTKAKAAGIAAGSALVGNAVGYLLGGKSTKSASDAASNTVTAEGETVSKTIKYTDPKTGKIYKETITAQGGTATAEAFANATATACAKVPILGQLAGPALAGLTAFLLTKGKTEDAFNGAKVEEVLEDLSLVKNADNQAIINKIQNLDLDDRVKAAVLTAAMGTGTKANTEELERAYQEMVKAKAAIDQIEVTEGEEEVDPPTTPPTDPPAEEPPAQEPCTDIEERQSHGDVIPSVQVKGHGQSPYWIAQAYVIKDADGNITELNAKQRAELQKLLAKEENKQVQEKGNFEGSKIGYRYRTQITLSDGTVVTLADDAAKRIGTGKTTKSRTVIKNGKMVKEERTVDCQTRQPVSGPEGQWHPAEE